MAKRGRPPRDREAERARAEAVLDEWQHARKLNLRFSRADGTTELFPKLAAEIQWLRYRLGDTEDAVDTLDAIIKPSTPPASNPVTKPVD